MTTKRRKPEMKLRKSPLVLVLGQVKFNEIPKLESHVPALEDEFRALRFPIQHRLSRKKVTVNFSGQVENVVDVRQWTFRTKDGSCLVILDDSQVVFQRTQYLSFEDFMETFHTVLALVLRVTNHRNDCLVERIGLRYVDAVPHASPGRGPAYYIKPEFLGVAESVFKADTKALGGATVGKTVLGDGHEGTLAVRILTAHGQRVPPDLLEFAPTPEAGTQFGTSTLLDLDHFWSGTLDMETQENSLSAIFNDLHDKINDVFFNHLVTDKAMEEWR